MLILYDFSLDLIMSNKNSTLNKEILEVFSDELLLLKKIDSLIESDHLSSEFEHKNMIVILCSSNTSLAVKKQLVNLYINKYNLLRFFLGGFYFTYKRLGNVYYIMLSLLNSLMVWLTINCIKYYQNYIPLNEILLMMSILSFASMSLLGTSYIFMRYQNYKIHGKIPASRSIYSTIIMTVVYSFASLILPIIVATLRVILKF